MAGITKITRVREVDHAEYRRLIPVSDRHGFHGSWHYFAVDICRDVRFPNAGPAQPISALVFIAVRYRINIRWEPAGIPARGAGRLTDGPPLAELMAAVAVRLPETWFIADVRPVKEAASLSVTVRKWPDTFEEFNKGRYDETSFEVSSAEALRPLEEVLRRINGTKPHVTGGPATRPAAPFKLLDKPSPSREVIVGRMRPSLIHLNMNGPGHGFYYSGSMEDRRTCREEGIHVFAAASPFDMLRDESDAMLTKPARPPRDALIVKDFWANNARAFVLLVPISLFDAPTTRSGGK